MATRTRDAEITWQDLAAHLGRQAPLPVYAILGEEPFARGQALAALREGVLAGADPNLALSQYTGAEAPSPPELLDELRTPPFLAPRRLVIIEDAAPFLTRGKDPLLHYLAKPASTATLALALDKLARNDKLYKAIAAAGIVVACEPPREYQLPGWISQRARTHGKRLDGEAAKLLAEYVGLNLPIIDQSLLKLALYVGARETITAADVEALVEDLPVTTIFKLTDAVGSKDPAKALRILDNLLEQSNEPPYILSMIRWALERLIVARTLLDLGQPPTALAKALRMRPGFFLDKTVEQARRRSRSELQHGFSLLLETDLATKSSPIPPRNLLESLLLKLCA